MMLFQNQKRDYFISNQRLGRFYSLITKKHKDFITIFNGALEVAKESLKRTPEQLSVLKNSGVVDAGAQGLLIS